jgi:hypothetical protein
MMPSASVIRSFGAPSFRDGPKDQTRNLEMKGVVEIPGSTLRVAPE